MKKRISERATPDVDVKVDLYHNNEIYKGTIKNLSMNGMYIDTYICPPCDSDIEVVLIQNDNVFKLRGKIKRTIKNKQLCRGIAVELFDPSNSYSEFVSSSSDQKQVKSNKERVLKLIKRFLPTKAESPTF